MLSLRFLIETRELANSPRLKGKTNNVKKLLFVQDQDWKQETINRKSEQKNSPLLLSISFFKKYVFIRFYRLFFPKSENSFDFLQKPLTKDIFSLQ